MRCSVRVPIKGSNGLGETYCYEPLRDDGTCPEHGQQAFAKPEWMSDDQFKAAMLNMHGQTVAFGTRPKRSSNPDTSDGGTQGGNSRQ